jgi:hypothetical protein
MLARGQGRQSRGPEAQNEQYNQNEERRDAKQLGQHVVLPLPPRQMSPNRQPLTANTFY